MDKAFSMGSMFGKFQYLISWFKVALVPTQISMVMKRNVSVCEILHFFLRNYCHLLWLKFVCYCSIFSMDILLRILSCFLSWIVSGQTLEFKLHGRILFFELIHNVTLLNFFVFLDLNSSLILKKLNSRTKQNKNILKIIINERNTQNSILYWFFQ